MDIELFRKTLKYREYVGEISFEEWDDEIEKCWKKETEILSSDIEGTIDFLKNECTEDEYSWISEPKSRIIYT